MAGKVAVRKVKRRGRIQWCVDRQEQGRRVREFFAGREAAEAHAVELRRQRSVAGAEWIRLSAAERAELIEVFAAARERGVGLRQVWQDWLARSAAPGVRMSLREAMRQCLAAKIAAGRRARYVEDLEGALGRFVRGREERDLASVTRAEIQAHVDGVAALHSRATRLNRLSTLFSWAVRAGVLAENPCRRVERVTPEAKVPVILTPEQAHRALAWTRAEAPRHLAWLTLALLAGVRPEEAAKSDWSAIKLQAEGGHVVIEAQASKVRWRRVVSLEALAVRWLREAQIVRAELPCVAQALKRFRRRLRDALGLTSWPADLLRHTAASYLLAKHQDAGKVAAMLGNSPGVLLRHYRELVTREQAAQFWEVGSGKGEAGS